MKQTIQMTPYVHRQPKPLKPSGIVFDHPRRNGHGRVVGHYSVSLESQIHGHRRTVLQLIHDIRDYRANGREDVAQQYFYELRMAIKSYRKGWKEYLKAMELA